MIHSARVRALLADRGISQSELARRVGVTQGAIAKIVSNDPGGSSHLHKIARELGTTPAYLTGEIDDPDEGAPPPPPTPTVQHIMMPVALPDEDTLAAMFEGLLAVVDLEAPSAELARELAQLLPTALSQARGRATDLPGPPPRRRREGASSALATADHEPPR